MLSVDNTIVLPQVAPGKTNIARNLVIAIPPFYAFASPPKDLSYTNGNFVQSGAVVRTTDSKLGVVFTTASTRYFTLSSPGTSLRFTGAMTAMCWAKQTSNTSDNEPFSHRNATTLKWAFQFNPSGTGDLSFIVSNDHVSYPEAKATGVVGANSNWYHICGVYRPSSFIRLYLNGVLVAENTTSIPASLFDDTTPLNIGSVSGSYTFTGSLAHLYLWSRDLDHSEIVNMYDDSWFIWRHDMPAYKYFPPTDLVSFYRFHPDPSVGTRPVVVPI